MRSVGATLVKLIATATSGLVSFTTNVIRPVKVTCEFSPIQEGTGDPSPDNVRPISGWTGCEIGHTGKNLFDGTVTNARIQNGEVVATGSYRLSGYIRVNPDTSYALVDKDGNLRQIFAHFFDENKTYLQSISTTDGTVVSPAGASYMRFHVTARSFGDQKPYMLFEGSAATAYEPYQGETIPITFTDPTTGDPMTVYGGTVTLNEDGSADLASDYVYLTINDLTKYGTVSERTDSRVFQWYNRQLNSIGGWKADIICEILKCYKNLSLPNVIERNGIYVYTTVSASSEVTTHDQFKAVYGNYHFAVPANAAQTYHFDNIGQLKSFLGTNNIWHNMNGDITVEYWNKQ